MVTEGKSVVYYCDICGCKFLTREDAAECEESHKTVRPIPSSMTGEY